MRKSFGWTFVCAGLALAGFTALQDRDAAAFIVAGLLVAVGVTLLSLSLSQRFRAGVPPTPDAPPPARPST